MGATPPKVGAARVSSRTTPTRRTIRASTARSVGSSIMVVVVGIGGGVDQVQILVDVGVGDGGAVHGREVLEPRGRDPVAAVVRARAAALGRVAASREGAGLLASKRARHESCGGLELMSFRATRRSAVDAAAVASARSTSMPCLRSGSGTPSSRSSVRGRDASRAASSLPPEAVLARRMPCAIWLRVGTLTRC